MLRSIALGVLALSFASTALAQTEPTEPTSNEQEARHHFEAGRALVQAESYEAARIEFQRGFEVSGRSLFLFNMAECARHLERSDDARREYAEFLRRDPSGAFSAIAAERLEELGPGDTSPPSFLADSPPNLEVPSDAPSPLETSPAALVAPEPAPAPESAEESGTKWYKHWAFWTVLGVVVVGGVVAVSVAASSGDSTPACTLPTCIDWQ